MQELKSDQDGRHEPDGPADYVPPNDGRRDELHRTLEALNATLAGLRAQLGYPTAEARQPPQPDGRVLLSAQAFAELTGFSVHTIRDWCEQGLLPAQKIGNRWRLDRDSAMMALKYLNRRRRRKRNGGKRTEP